MKLTIALFSEAGKTNYHCIFSTSTSQFTSLIRKSAWVEVDFPEREDSPEAIQEEVDSIDREMERVIEDNMEKLKALKAKKTAALSKVFQAETVA
jgi:hypothetical protein